MPLTGVNPNDATPSVRREIVFGVGPNTGAGTERFVLIFGNKTSAGSETADTLGLPVQGDADARSRFGKRSEWYQMYRKYIAVDTSATIYGIAVTDASGGTAATCTFTLATTATADTTVDVFWGGYQTSFTVRTGDTAITQCAALVAAINNAEGGTWPFTASQGSPSNDHIATLTAANVGDRGTFVLSRVRVQARDSVGTTYSKSSVTNGSGTDDFTAALALAASAGEYYYQVSPKHSTSSVTATDNGIGEHITMITTQANATNGKGQQVFFGLVGTQAQAAAVATSSAANSARAKFFRAENNDWTPGMLAAHNAAVQRQAEIAHPSANINGWTNSDSQVYQIPDPYDKSDRPTTDEIIADQNNGVCPIAFRANGASYLVHSITSRSLDSLGQSDYKCREGHIPSADDFAWSVVKSRYASEKQPFIADELGANEKPLPGVMYPSSLKALVVSVIDDLTSANPLGLYKGPILNPSKADAMKQSVVVTKVSGGLYCAANFEPVEHNNHFDMKISDTSPAQF
jgi:phage tail sheath gpL-like